MDENEVLQQLQHGDNTQLKYLMTQYKSLVYRVLLRFCNNQHDLEDLFQEVWIKVFFKIKDLKKPGSFRSWLINIAYNLGIDYLRKATIFRKKRKDIDDSFFLEIQESFERDVYKTVWDEIKKLRLKYQLPLIMFFFERFSYEEIADVADIKINTVKSLIKRGKEILGENLKKRGVDLWTL